jgi:hypothetical protein
MLQVLARHLLLGEAVMLAEVSMPVAVAVALEATLESAAMVGGTTLRI